MSSYTYSDIADPAQLDTDLYDSVEERIEDTKLTLKYDYDRVEVVYLPEYGELFCSDCGFEEAWNEFEKGNLELEILDTYGGPDYKLGNGYSDVWLGDDTGDSEFDYYCDCGELIEQGSKWVDTDYIEFVEIEGYTDSTDDDLQIPDGVACWDCVTDLFQHPDHDKYDKADDRCGRLYENSDSVADVTWEYPKKGDRHLTCTLGCNRVTQVDKNQLVLAL